MRSKLVVTLGVAILLTGCQGARDFWDTGSPVAKERGPVPPPHAQAYMQQQQQMSQGQPTESQIPQIPVGNANNPYNGNNASTSNAGASSYKQMPSYPVEHYNSSNPPPSNYGNYDTNSSSSNNDVSPFEQKVLSREKAARTQLQAFRVYTSNDKNDSTTAGSTSDQTVQSNDASQDNAKVNPDAANPADTQATQTQDNKKSSSQSSSSHHKKNNKKPDANKSSDDDGKPKPTTTEI